MCTFNILSILSVWAVGLLCNPLPPVFHKRLGPKTIPKFLGVILLDELSLANCARNLTRY